MKKGYLKIYAKIIFFMIVIGIIVAVAIYFTKEKYEEEIVETIKTDMLSIEAQTKQTAEKVNMKEKDAEYIGTKIEENNDNEDVKILQEKQIIDITNKDRLYYILEKEHLDMLGLSDISLQEGVYIVEYNSNEIIYSKGIEDSLRKCIIYFNRY